MNACADWILGTLPVFMVKNLRLSLLTKVLIAGILAFAAVYVLLFPKLTLIPAHMILGEVQPLS